MTLSASPDARPLRYRVDRWIRGLVMRVIGWCAPKNHGAVDRLPPSMKRILLVRANFRMGNAILALPAVAAFHKNFPDAQIDFVGSPVSQVLFRHQPLSRHYIAPRRFPWVVWQYLLLIRRLRANRYDLAVDVSCSQSGVGSFIVGVSGAKIRAGLAGKWDQLFNFKILKLREGNKYRKLTEFLTAMRLEQVEQVPSLEISAAEKLEGSSRIDSVIQRKTGKTVGVFLGGRKLRGKRWPLENFVELINGLDRHCARVVAFIGPEENDIANALRDSLAPTIPIVCEPSVGKFAAMVASLHLFICCDSGPMHLACAAGVPVLAIFQERDVERWAPPRTAARAVYGTDGVSAAEVLSAALEELSMAGSTEAFAIAAAPAPIAREG